MKNPKLVLVLFFVVVLIDVVIILFLRTLRTETVSLLPDQSASLVNGDVSISITHLGEGSWKCTADFAIACDENAIIFHSQEMIPLSNYSYGDDFGNVYLSNNWTGTILFDQE